MSTEKDESKEKIQLKIKQLRERRKRKSTPKITCPKCSIEMKRKGKEKNIYFKCPKCKSKWIGGEFVEPGMAEAQERNIILKTKRKEESKRKLIRMLKKQKYLPYKSLEFGGQIINLDEYDKNGNPLVKESIEEKKEEQGNKEG